MGGLKILVDPILVGNLDFGIPWLYDAAKKVLKNFQVLFFIELLLQLEHYLPYHASAIIFIKRCCGNK